MHLLTVIPMYIFTAIILGSINPILGIFVLFLGPDIGAVAGVLLAGFLAASQGVNLFTLLAAVHVLLFIITIKTDSGD